MEMKNSFWSSRVQFHETSSNLPGSVQGERFWNSPEIDPKDESDQNSVYPVKFSSTKRVSSVAKKSSQT